MTSYSGGIWNGRERFEGPWARCEHCLEEFFRQRDFMGHLCVGDPLEPVIGLGWIRLGDKLICQGTHSNEPDCILRVPDWASAEEMKAAMRTHFKRYHDGTSEHQEG